MTAPSAPPHHRDTYARVACDDPVVATMVSTWLADAQLDWPGPFELQVLTGASHPFAVDTRDVFTQPSITIQAGAPSHVVRIAWDNDTAIAEVDATEARATMWLSPKAIARFHDAERGFLLVVLVFLMRRLGWFHVHAASMIDRQQRGWLIAGNSNCGKSTTTALMATRGWHIATDDIGFLARDGSRICSLGMRTPIALREGGLAMLGATGGIDMRRRQKSGFWAEDLGGAWTPRVIPEIVAFPSIGERTTITPASPRAALAALVQWSAWVLYEPAFSQEHLDVLGLVAQQSRCFNLTLGPDLFDNPNHLEELVP
ncbi:MAG: hypothetical protein IT353_07505 [Gemmatimonadaceae bacterium]|nr:hypothetical protein [Gemmatimonadaceae bacterium]